MCRGASVSVGGLVSWGLDIARAQQTLCRGIAKRPGIAEGTKNVLGKADEVGLDSITGLDTVLAG